MPFAPVRRPPPSHGRTCRLEPLEDRRLLAGVPELVKDINTTPRWEDFSSAAVGSTLFFTNFVEATGYELWKTDGTADGTSLVKDLLPGPASSHPRAIAPC